MYYSGDAIDCLKVSLKNGMTTAELKFAHVSLFFSL